MLALLFFYENITQKNYLIVFEHVDKLSKKNIYLSNILDLDLKIFGLRIWTALNLLDLDCKSLEEQLSVTLIRYFAGVGLENTWDYEFVLQLLSFT